MMEAENTLGTAAFFQGASSLRRSEGGPRSNRLWTLSALGAGKGLFRPRMHIQLPLGTAAYRLGSASSRLTIGIKQR